MLTARSAVLGAVIAALVGATGCGGGGGSATGPSDPASGSAVVALDSTTFEMQVLESSQPSLVEFWSPACRACQSMAPVVERLAADFQGRALVGSVDVTLQVALANDQRIGAVPSFLFFKGGAEVSRLVGATSYEELAARIEALLSAP
jgi:thioredoxin